MGASSAPPLGFASLLALGINGIVGVGIFFAPREVATAVPGWRGVTVYLAVITMIINLLVDVMYKWVDPRVSFK